MLISIEKASLWLWHFLGPFFSLNMPNSTLGLGKILTLNTT